ncbi:MAG: hypothetical protein QM308_03120 [Bacillota bacterium]|nr:hypothetical protein [Bacillota bacterium]
MASKIHIHRAGEGQQLILLAHVIAHDVKAQPARPQGEMGLQVFIIRSASFGRLKGTTILLLSSLGVMISVLSRMVTGSRSLLM